MKTLTIKVPESLENRLRSIAVRRGESKSAVIRTALEDFVGSESEVREGSCLDLARDLAGSTEGPRDLSINKRHLAGYGR
jgi:Arc/MetJ-type ribon-helix-helix transcriptional regulator